MCFNKQLFCFFFFFNDILKIESKINDTPKAPLSFLPGPELKDPLGSTNLFTESV